MIIIVLCVQMPAGAISIFGPGTKSLQTERLMRHRVSTSNESETSEKVGIISEAV